MPVEHIAPVLEQVKVEMGLRLSAQQEAAVYAAFRHVSGYFEPYHLRYPGEVLERFEEKTGQ